MSYLSNMFVSVYTELNSFSMENKVDFLYHYTTFEAFDSILNSKEIRLSDCTFLNDSSEITLGKDKIIKYLNSKHEEYSKLTKDKEYYISKINSLFHNLTINISNFPRYYVFCLCEEDDLLSQWRGYAKNSCPIGLKFGIEHIGLNAALPRTYLFKVIYNESKQNNIIEEIIEYYLKTKTDEKDFKPLLTNTILALFLAIVFFKHPGFQEEKEWRHVYYQFPEYKLTKELFFHKKDKFMLPYIKFEFNELFPISKDKPIKEIVIGPQSDELSKKSIVEYISSTKLNIPISYSSIPYRT